MFFTGRVRNDRHFTCLTNNLLYVYVCVYTGKEFHPLLQLGVVAIEKGAFGSSSAGVAKFNNLLCAYVEREFVFV